MQTRLTYVLIVEEWINKKTSILYGLDNIANNFCFQQYL